MPTTKLKIANDFGESLDVLVEGNEAAKEIIIFVHGYGTDKDEGFVSFIDLSNAFKNEYLNIRYDQAGYGKSEGETAEFHLQKSAGDLRSIIRWANEKYPDKAINILAHSIGSFVTLLLSPAGIQRIVFTGIPNSNTDYVAKNLQRRIMASGGKIDENGVTTYPRSRGGIQLIGKDFWRTLRSLQPVTLLTRLANTTPIAIFKPIQDDVLGPEYFEEYKNIPGVSYVELAGDHNFTNLKDRQNVVDQIREFLTSPK